jgi:hypothetical protein
VLSLMFYLYFFQGFKVFLRLTIKDYFKHYLKLEPDEAQYYSSIMDIPWVFKVFYGMFADNVPVFRSYRNSYLYLTAIAQFLCMFPLSLEGWEDKHVVLGLMVSY